MKQTIKLPLLTIYSLIQDMEEMANNPEVAKQHNDLLSALEVLKETFMPLIDEFKDCRMIPDIDASVDTDNMESKNHGDDSIDWEQRRYELTKAAMQSRISIYDKNYNFHSIKASIAKDAVEMADTVIDELRNG